MSAVSQQQPCTQQKCVDSIQPTQKSHETLKKILIISAIALAAIAAIGGIVALTILFPHVMIPVLIFTVGLPLVPFVGVFFIFGKFGH